MDIESQPEATGKATEHKFVCNDDDSQSETRWKSCCFIMDKAVVFFFAQLTISLFIMTFCVSMLIQPDSLESRQYYSGTLTFILGIWIPSPRIRVN